jgi:hypothetical protein
MTRQLSVSTTMAQTKEEPKPVNGFFVVSSKLLIISAKEFFGD